jgi:hypothetical protein
MSITDCLWKVGHIYMSKIDGNRSVVVMGGVFSLSGSWEIVKLIIIARLKMEDTYIFYNVIETF